MFVLAALLGPRDFGIVSLAMIYIAFVQMIQTQGFQTALVQRAELAPEHFDTIFWTNALLSLAFALLSLVFARCWTAFHGLALMARYVGALSICIPLQGLTIVQVALLQRRMDFRSLSVRTNVSVLCGGVAGLTLAWLGLGIWALIFQQIVRDLVALALLWRLVEWRPRLRYSARHLRDLLHFSLTNFTAQLAVFIDTQGAAVLMGIFFGPVPVGLYRIAERVVSSVTTVATSSIQVVSLPEFARHQDSPPALKASVLTCVRIAAVLTLPAMAGLIVTSHPLMALIGPQWLPATNALRLLSLLGMFFMFSMFTGPLLQALGRPAWLAVLEWSRTLAGFVLLFAGGWMVRNGTVSWQVTGIALARCCTGALLVTPLYLFLLLRFGRVSFREASVSVYPSVLSACSILSVAALLHVSGLLSSAPPAVVLAAHTALGGAAAACTYLTFDRALRGRMVHSMRHWLRGPIVSKEGL